MKHISEYLLEVTQLQTILQSRLDAQEALILSLSGNPDSINTLATMPKLEADLCITHSLNSRINKVINAASVSR